MPYLPFCAVPCDRRADRSDLEEGLDILHALDAELGVGSDQELDILFVSPVDDGVNVFAQVVQMPTEGLDLSLEDPGVQADLVVSFHAAGLERLWYLEDVQDGFDILIIKLIDVLHGLEA